MSAAPRPKSAGATGPGFAARISVRRSHPLAALLLFIGALFVRHAAECGMVGRWVAQRVSVLVGSYGAMLLAVTLAGAGVLVGVPIVIWRVLRLAMQTAERAFRERVKHTARPQRTSSPAVGSMSTPLPSPRSTAAALAPAFEKDLRTYLHNLGYTATEIAAVIPRLEPAPDFDRVVRQSLSLLRNAV